MESQNLEHINDLEASDQTHEQVLALEHELIEQHQDTLKELGYGIQLYPLPKHDFSNLSGIANQVMLYDIPDIKQWVVPFFNQLPQVKQKLAFYLSNPDQAVTYSNGYSPIWNNPLYNQAPSADKAMKKLVAVGSIENGTNNVRPSYSRSKFIFQLPKLEADARISCVLNYFLTYKGEFINKPVLSTSRYLQQDIIQRVIIQSLPANVINPSPTRIYENPVIIKKIDSRVTPLGQDTLNYSGSTGPKLQTIDFDGYKDHIYTIELSVYAYSATAEAQAACQVELQLLEFA